MNSREFKERYVFDPQHDLIAEGTYSRVFRAVDSLLQRDICIKYFRKELIAGSPLTKELSRAGIFFHPNICAFYDLVEIEETNVLGEVDAQPIGIVEYVNGGMLTDYVQKHKADAEMTKKLIKDVIKGLSYLHSLGKPHLDIKPGNLLVKLTEKDPVAKISDFLNNENIHALSVPSSVKPQQLSYKAPEYFEGAYGELSAKADIWALGLIVFELITDEQLFYKDGDTVEKVIRNICHSDHWVRVHDLPEPYVTFVKKCLVRNVQERNVSLEELTLILDGYKAEETKAVVPIIKEKAIAPVAPIVEKTVEEVKPVVPMAAVIEPIPVVEPIPVIVAATPIPVVKPTPVAPKPESKSPEKKLGLSIPIIAGAMIILAGISAFIWQIIDDKDHTNHVVRTAAMAKTDTIERAIMVKEAASAKPLIIHDTIKVVQIQQKAMPVAYTPPAKVSTLSDGNQITAPAPKINVHVMPTLPSFDVLYTDKPYYFDLKTPLLSEEEFDLYSSDAVITALGKNTFYVKPSKQGQVNVMVLDKGNHALIAQKEYTVKSNRPVAMIGDDIVGGFVSPKMLLAKLTMQAKSDNGGTYKVKSFRMTCKSGSCDINDVSNDGTFNESMIRFLHNVKSGEQLYFDNIVAEGDNGQPIKLDNFQVTTY
jgi:serine/threonine protein kinase/Cu/Ag efflux protein CusF